MFYNLQALNCVQKVAGYPGKRSAVAEPNTKLIGPDGSLLELSGPGLVGVHSLTPGLVGPEGILLANGQYLKPSVGRPDGRPLVFGKRSAVAAPEAVPTLNLVPGPTLIHAPAHDSASIESHGLASGNFAYGQGLIGGHGLVGSGPGLAHGLIGGHGIAHGLVGLHGPAHGLIGGPNVREPSGMVHSAGHSGFYLGKRSAVAKRTPNTKADANGHGLVGGPSVVNVLGPDGKPLVSGQGLVGVHGPTPGVANVLRPDGSILGHYILESGHGLVFVPGRTADVVAPGIGRPLNLARPVVEKRKIR